MDDQQTPIEQLRAVMAALRTPDTGCPWDLKQDFASIAPYTIEEAYEVVDAIARGNMDDLKLELGDLLLQVVFHARMAEEQGLFDFNDVAMAISDKMKYRHPHVFSDTHVADAGQVQDNWEALKAAERAEKAPDSGPQSLMDDVPTALPGLTRAVKLQKRAAQVGFDWQAAAPILAKLDEEVAEFKAEMNAETIDEQRLTDEFGDILFVMANLARHLKLDPETAIRSTNSKFDRRFRFIEQKALENGEKMDEMSLEALEAYWQESKHIVG
ncbi:MAG: nucleoside triphosphate pyrophosphohydrolase [Parvibaculales bacterium]